MGLITQDWHKEASQVINNNALLEEEIYSCFDSKSKKPTCVPNHVNCGLQKLVDFQISDERL